MFNSMISEKSSLRMLNNVNIGLNFTIRLIFLGKSDV